MMETYEVQGRKLCVPGEGKKQVDAVRTLMAKRAAKKAAKAAKTTK